MGFAALADLKAQLNIPSSDTSNDAELQIYLDASNEIAESLIGKSASTAFTERQGTVDGSIVLMQRPLVTVETVTPVGGVALLTTAYYVDLLRNGIQVFGGATLDYDIAYHAGWTSLPARGKLGQMIVAQHLWETQRGGMVPSVVGAEPLVQMPGLGYAIPRRAVELFASAGGPLAVPGIA